MEETNTTAVAPNKGGVNPIFIVIVVVLVFAGLGYMMVQSNTDTASTDVAPTPTEAVPVTDGGSKTGDAMTDTKTVTIEAGSFYYKPNVIRVKKGQRVKIVMNAVSMMHNFNIDELKVKMPIVKNGDTETVEFTADRVGSFEFYCSVGQHRAQGQIGTLIVE